MSERLEEIIQQLREEKGITTPSNSEVSGIVKSDIDELKSFIKAEIDGLKVEMRGLIQSEITRNNFLENQNNQLKGEIEKHKAKVEKLEKDKKSLIATNKSVKTSTQTVSSKQPSTSYQTYNFPTLDDDVAKRKPTDNSSKFTEKFESSSKIPKNNTRSSAVAPYNELITCSGNKFRQARDNFWNKFDVKFFSCGNSSARMNDPNLEPIFNDVPAKNGDYWALSSSGSFEVFPRLGVYNDNLHNERAMGIVFDSNFQSGKVYEKIHVESPAKFSRNGNNWILERKGRLVLE